MESCAADAIAAHLILEEVVRPLNEAAPDSPVTFEVTYGNRSDNSAARIDVEGPHAIGRLTWWSDGSFYAEALRVSDGTELYSRHGIAERTAAAVGELRQMVERLTLGGKGT